MPKKEDVDVFYTPAKSAKSSSKSGKVIAIRLVAVAVIAVLAFVCIRQYLAVRGLRNPDKSASQAHQEAQDVKAKAARLIQLPDEDATIATVQDASKLSGQDFFVNAQDGDRVLIFSEAKKAVIYRESADLIINSGPIVINSALE
ncbi:hypothetical protein FWH30_02485 [Microgenomates group bacterium]|nr:hypothetical protein [Microgenomates group bacterium]